MNSQVVYCFAVSPTPSMNVHISPDPKAATLPPVSQLRPLVTQWHFCGMASYRYEVVAGKKKKGSIGKKHLSSHGQFERTCVLDLADNQEREALHERSLVEHGLQSDEATRM